jgi:hypothetical protein
MHARQAWICFGTTLMLLMSAVHPAMAQVQIDVPEITSYTFGEQIDIRCPASMALPPGTASLLLKIPGYLEEKAIPASIQLVNEAESEIVGSYFPVGDELPAFSTMSYRCLFTNPAGQSTSSPSAEFQYIDNRFDWQALNGKQARIHWYQGDDSLASSVEGVISNFPQRVVEYLDLSLPEPVDIYLYADTESLQAALAQTGHNWVAGRAEPEKGVILVALPPGPDQQILAEQRIPHEMMHIALFLTLGDNYFNLPAWLNEGLASVAEQYPNAEYPALVKTAYQETGLPSMSSLCPGFPSEASTAVLAYAQSTLFTRFILERYGKEGMKALVSTYASGQDCENGAATALGMPLSELEQTWRDTTFGERLSSESQANDFLPWIAVILATLGVPLIIMWIVLRQKRSQDAGSVQ